jgi:hypothetical protein
MCGTPLSFEFFNLFVAEAIRFKFTPGIEPAHVAEG